VAAVRAYLANLQGEACLAVDYAQGALEYLPDSNAFSCSLRSVATSILGDASWMTGNLQDARYAYLEAVRISQAAGSIYMTMIANSNLADVLMEQGELHQAARIFSETLQIATRPDGQKLPIADRSYAGLSEISYEWNHLELAAQYIHQCIELCQQWENSNLLAKGYVMLARLERAMCNLEKAQEAMRAAEQMASEKRLSPRQSVWVKYACARWWIAQGSLERASHLVQQSGVTLDSISRDAGIPYWREPEYLLLIRLQLAQGDYEAALSLAECLLPMAEATKRMGRVIEVLVLQALALQGQKDIARAMVVLGKALSIAQPEGYARVFLDEGEPMPKLLYQAKSHRIISKYASELLAALGGVSGTELPPAQLLIEPLTLRELEVLKLIQAGFSNLDIADRLVISVPTVKRHISNIYAKLGVKSRTQAVSLGRELRLFE
jgi:LuxR family maltose regulon positive regulatory protein